MARQVVINICPYSSQGAYTSCPDYNENSPLRKKKNIVNNVGLN